MVEGNKFRLNYYHKSHVAPPTWNKEVIPYSRYYSHAHVDLITQPDFSVLSRADIPLYFGITQYLCIEPLPTESPSATDGNSMLSALQIAGQLRWYYPTSIDPN